MTDGYISPSDALKTIQNTVAEAAESGPSAKMTIVFREDQTEPDAEGNLPNLEKDVLLSDVVAVDRLGISFMSTEVEGFQVDVTWNSIASVKVTAETNVVEIDV